MLFGGIALIALGLALFGVLLLGGLAAIASPRNGDKTLFSLSGLPIGLTFLGLGMTGYALYLMWWIPRSASLKTTISDYPGVYVVSRFAFDRQQLMQFPTSHDEEMDLKYYVQIQWPDGRRAELRTRPETYFATGEGMIGTASIQGDWLGKFVPSGKAPRSVIFE